jgi:hypothetical protein
MQTVGASLLAIAMEKFACKQAPTPIVVGVFDHERVTAIHSIPWFGQRRTLHLWPRKAAFRSAQTCLAQRSPVFVSMAMDSAHPQG